MKVQTNWKNKMLFEAHAAGQVALMDAKAPIGSGSAPTPKELLLAAICGCSGMDVVAMLRKYRATPRSLEIGAEATLTENVYPAIFREIRLTYKLEGEIEPAQALEAVTLSQTKYCGVSAMIAKAVPMHYVVILNGQEIGQGEAKFEG